VPAAGVPEYYRRRAAGGVGLVIVEGSAIPHSTSAYSRNIPKAHGAEALAMLRKVVDAVHGEGSRIALQLWHAGLARKPSDAEDPDEASVGPTAHFPGGEQPARALTETDIADIIAAYGEAAANARAAGFDAINIHGAHGYLIDQFLWPVTNTRTDSWNGTLVERARFGVEVIREMRRRVGPDFPLMLRYSQWKIPDYRAALAQTPAELAPLLEAFVDAGIDAFDASTRRFWEPAFAGSDLNLAGWTKKLTGKDTMSVGSVGLDQSLDPRGMRGQDQAAAGQAHMADLVKMLDRGDFDVIAAGRVLLANPEWPRLAAEGRFAELRPFDPRMLATLECSEVELAPAEPGAAPISSL